MRPLSDLLLARSVAVVGASGNPDKTGYTLLDNLLRGGFEGPVYPVNLREESILGQRCYPSLADIPGPVDLVVVCVPAGHVAGVLEQAAEKGSHGAIIISGGFREIGNEAAEDALLAIARRGNMRLIGPNCQGVNYTGNRLCATWPYIDGRGGVGIVSQSGTIGAEVALLAEQDGLGISCFAALGNKLDISEIDFIDFFRDDPNTKVIALNVEGLRDGFAEAVARAARVKPVVVLKPGRTLKGMAAMMSHTRSIAGNDRLFSAFCRKHGILRADDLTEFYDLIKVTQTMTPPEGNRLLVVTSSGGTGILATDTAEARGLEIMPLAPALREALTEQLPAQCVLSNPLDLTGDATARRYADVFDTLAASPGSPGCDAILAIFGDPIPGAAEVIHAAREALGIPIAVSYLGGGAVQAEEVARMGADGVAVFPTPERAVVALGGLYRRGISCTG